MPVRDNNIVYVIMFCFVLLWLCFTFLPAFLKSRRAQESKELAMAEEMREQQRHEVSQKREKILNEYLQDHPKESLVMLGKSSASRSRRRSAKSSVQTKNASKVTNPKRNCDQPATPKQPVELMGELEAHGRAKYHHKKDENFSYFVTLILDDNSQMTLWGIDLKRAVSVSGAKIGERIKLERGEKRQVTVKAKRKDEKGDVIGTELVSTYRQEWNCTIV